MSALVVLLDRLRARRASIAGSAFKLEARGRIQDAEGRSYAFDRAIHELLRQHPELSVVTRLARAS